MDVCLAYIQNNCVIFGQYLGKGSSYPRTIRTIYSYQYYFVFLFHIYYICKAKVHKICTKTDCFVNKIRISIVIHLDTLYY